MDFHLWLLRIKVRLHFVQLLCVCQMEAAHCRHNKQHTSTWGLSVENVRLRCVSIYVNVHRTSCTSSLQIVRWGGQLNLTIQSKSTSLTKRNHFQQTWATNEGLLSTAILLKDGRELVFPPHLLFFHVLIKGRSSSLLPRPLPLPLLRLLPSSTKLLSVSQPHTWLGF